MSTDHWKLDRDLCRCCLAEGSFQNLSEPFFIKGREEIYSEMLKETLNIEVSQISGEYCTITYTICDDCIKRLRDAHDFKQLVLTSEHRFQDMYRNIQKALDNNVEIEIKLEDDMKDPVIKQECLDDDDFATQSLSDDDDDNKTVLQLKKENEAKKPKPKAKPKKKVALPSAQKKKEAKTSKEQKKGACRFILKDEDYKKIGEQYVCSHCDNKYSNYTSLWVHIKSKHYNFPKFSCKECQEQFKTPGTYTLHKLEVHNVDDRVRCKACDAVFNTKIGLRIHIKTYHMLGRKLKCEFCDYESYSESTFRKHKIKHTTVKKFHCQFCKKSFLRKTTLNFHERIHTGDKRKVCKVCGEAFVQKASLNYHMTKHHPEVNF